MRIVEITKCIHLTKETNSMLITLAKKENKSESQMVRNLILAKNYENVLKELQTSNEILKETLYQISKYGSNLNQIAYHLNTDISTTKQAQETTIPLMNEVKELLNSNKKLIENLLKKRKC
ncbi:plasmid mobilization relaxosome protein MobC [Helicobacter sp.]|uniref:plasmid mobilization relaxosome protein MobC n=1 Tax=Helicobacter sp. TaxID=218 RepID=UPI002A90E699|nr:plasmid mobilization relaxosome protein MobC [Helicobacter sp.]MDY5556178.1 plasmid mobilization relaxosome protein MobC [Helicobacter sp.]